MALVVSTRDPAADRFAALLQAVVFSPLGMLIGLVAAGVLASSRTLLSWLIVVLATSLGLIPLVRWRSSLRRPDHVSVWGLDSLGRRHIASATMSVRRIENARAELDDGAAAEHLDLVHHVAVSYVRAMGSAMRCAGSKQGREFRDRPYDRSAESRDVESIGLALSELADEAERLARAARRDTPDRLRELTERTRLMRQALDEQTIQSRGELLG